MLASLAQYTPAPGPHSGRGCLGPRWSQGHSAMGSQEAGVPTLPDLLGVPLSSLTGQPPSLPSWWRWRRGPGARPPPSLGGSAQLDLDSLHPSPPSSPKLVPSLLRDTQPPKIQQAPQPTWAGRALTPPPTPSHSSGSAWGSGQSWAPPPCSPRSAFQLSHKIP